MIKPQLKLLFLYCFVCTSVNSQTPFIDSLIKIANSTKVDTQKVKLYGDITWEFLSSDISQAEIYAQKQLDLSKKINNDAFIAQAESDMGSVLNRKGDFDGALPHYLNALKLREKLRQPVKVAGIYSNIATLLIRQNKFKEAIDVNFKSLKIFEEAHDILKQAIIVGNIGHIYYELEQNKQAEVYFRRSLALSKNAGDPGTESSAMINLGGIKYEDQEMDSALYYFYGAEKILSKNKMIYGLGAVYNNIGKILLFKNEDSKAMEYYKLGLDNRIQTGDEYGIALSYLNLGGLYAKSGNHSKAMYCLERSEPVLKKDKAFAQLKDCYYNMAVATESKGDLLASLNYLKLFSQYKDSVYTKESSDMILEMNAKYQTEKKEQENKLLNIQNALSEKTIKQQRTFNYFIITGLFLVAALAFFIFRGLKQQKRANQIISEQKKEVEIKSHIIQEKHREITDSINYAERIQRSFLATKELLDENLKEYFVLFLPKDVVSGDFYWASKLNNGNFALVVADSTGHGVPGAIMSILNISSLENAVKEASEPSAILDLTRKYIIERLKKDGSKDGGKDGMDASLLSIDSNKKELTYSSANNSILIARDSNIIELEPDKMPVGKHDKDHVPFSQAKMDLKNGDVIYSLTDGFPDQFGGPKGKKFMYKKLKELLVSIAHLPLAQQKETISTTLKEWKGNLEQVDDICIVGIRIT